VYSPRIDSNKGVNSGALAETGIVKLISVSTVTSNGNINIKNAAKR
jgi:hypothetical protein